MNKVKNDASTFTTIKAGKNMRRSFFAGNLSFNYIMASHSVTNTMVCKVKQETHGHLFPSYGYI